MTPPILPGSTVGVFGSGQLGRMFAVEARKLGYRVHTYSPASSTPTGAMADVEIAADYDDLDAVREFARGVDVVTFEFENVSANAAAAAAEIIPVRPDGTLLYTTQNRLREKQYLRARGFPVTDFTAVDSPAGLRKALDSMGELILKTTSWGYDGKGQARIRRGDSVENAWNTLDTDCAIAEKLVDFEAELSVVVARGAGGEIRSFEVTRNDHVNGILDLSVCPSGFDTGILEEAQEIARGIARTSHLVGVLCIEMFLDSDGRILVNELAPRPHNSGHWTFDAAVTSQFEQQLRAICGLPLGETRRTVPAVAMVNLLGDLWNEQEPHWGAALEMDGIKLHLYGKGDARPGRKMGHITAYGQSPGEAKERALEARRRLTG
ncbi:MAG: 5-(carboxyamino)imidazole ribonucleotide synthase [Acidobacteria bacterium]|nr:5-(carboxyamino)imidazole ribonucleotide synthase [Acidobacteriota bacterium]